MGVFQHRASGGPEPVPRLDRPRVPPNQSVTTSFHTLTAEQVPSVDVNNFTFRFWGEVREPTEMTWQQLMAVKHMTLAADFHCVTGWSMLGSEWGGALVRDVLEAAHVELSTSARFVMAHCITEFTANLPLEALLADDTMLVWEWNGLPLTSEHGGPIRLLVPSLYAWKDAKWVSGFEFLTEDRPGFWESRGYHMHGDPWKEERYG
ncbi:sulfite oxidase-like oxidoreductase [Candidatus Cryosericum septentrionale]|jgi:DMSO/TMAO reductase YedYZ molybdopterin-dependent catalytic subunit|uniref:Sulfite oxidase-like oxidoreductase n=1 Tax=Candidatus Cryosericum septentrionale TaxID=2290913 RepID=A0A398DZU6_9BACT|nr:sulfite oxidase-like oxidoreductase [Candidatus Cryosericum septentrionale]